MSNLIQCAATEGLTGCRCHYANGHSGDHLFSNDDESDEIRRKLAADERNALRSRLAEVTRERDEAVKEATWRIENEGRAAKARDVAIQRAEQAELLLQEYGRFAVHIEMLLGPSYESRLPRPLGLLDALRALKERAETAEANYLTAQREADRLRHNEWIESDFICPTELDLHESNHLLSEFMRQDGAPPDLVSRARTFIHESDVRLGTKYKTVLK